MVPYTANRTPEGEMRIFREWNDVECAELIARYLDRAVEEVYDPTTGLFWSYIGPSEDLATLGSDHV